MDKQKYYTVLPYIIVEKTFRFGEYVIWQDNDKNWKRYVGIKRPKELLDIYVNRKGEAIGHMTIITSTKDFDSERLRELITCLFFIPSQRHYFRFSADTFHNETYFETESANKNNKYHTRVDKFVRSIVSNNEYKIYQNTETDIQRFELRHLEIEEFGKLRKLFANNKDRNVLRSLVFYFKTQYRSLFLFPDIEDVQNFCTAFEIFFKVDTMGTGEEVANRLFNHFSLAEEDERKELKDWFIKLYDLRSDYTHGKEFDYNKLIYKGQRHIDIAKQVYCETINKLFKPKRGPGKYILSSDKSLLVALFSSQKVFDDLVKAFTKGWKKSKSGQKNVNYLINCQLEELNLIRNLAYKFILYVKKPSLQNINKNRLKEAMQTALSVMAYFVANKNTVDKNKYYVEVLDEIGKQNLLPKTEEELESTYNYFKVPNIKYNEVIGSFDDAKNLKFRDEIKLQDLFDISLFAHVFEEMYTVYREWY